MKTVLMANRGEIALRILRACRDAGLRVAVVYSTEDAHSGVVALADKAVCIGPAQARRSYLNGAAIIEAARRAGADAVHPGYGFLSEDPDFAEACERSGLKFIGPPAGVVAQLGDKAAARALMKRAGVPTLPGSGRPVEDAKEAMRAAAGLGYPVIVKAVGGGGGGRVDAGYRPQRLPPSYQDARAAAPRVFGDDRVLFAR